MKEYKVHDLRKTRSDLGNCLACGEQIMKGEQYRHGHISGGIIYFCAVCPVNQALIGKNKFFGVITETVKPVVEETKSVEQEVKETLPETPIEQKPDVVDNGKKNAAYCSKCKGTHTVGSRRYRQHGLYLS